MKRGLWKTKAEVKKGFRRFCDEFCLLHDTNYKSDTRIWGYGHIVSINQAVQIYIAQVNFHFLQPTVDNYGRYYYYTFLVVNKGRESRY